jgi:hypothetical protein
MEFDFACGDEVYGSCPALRSYLEEHSQGYVLRVPKTFPLTLGAGITLPCAKVVTTHLRARRHWQAVSAGTGSKGERAYAWAWIATASPQHWLLIRRHLATGECAYHYCHVPAGQPVSLKRLITAAGLRWPVEEACAPRGAPLYSRRSREELGGRFLGLMAYPAPKGLWGQEHARKPAAGLRR